MIILAPRLFGSTRGTLSDEGSANLTCTSLGMAESKSARHILNWASVVTWCKFATNLSLGTWKPPHRYKGPCKLGDRLIPLEDMVTEQLQKNNEENCKLKFLVCGSRKPKTKTKTKKKSRSSKLQPNMQRSPAPASLSPLGAQHMWPSVVDA